MYFPNPCCGIFAYYEYCTVEVSHYTIMFHLLCLLPFHDHAQQVFPRFYLHLIPMDLLNPLCCILDCHYWYPKSNHHTLVNNSYLLLFQFLNQPPAFASHLSNLEQTPIALFPHTILQEPFRQKFNQIHSTIGPHSVKLLQVSILVDTVSGSDFEVVLTAHAAEQARFLGWRRRVFEW